MTLLRVTNTIVEVHADWNPAAVITQYHVEVALLRGKRLARLRFDPLTGKLCPVCCRVNVAEADLTFAPLQLEAAGSFSTTDVYSAAASLTFAPLQLEAEATHTAPVYSAAADLTFAPLELTATAAFAADVFVSTAELVFAPLTLAAAATHTPPPTFTAAADLTFAALELDATAAFAAGVFLGVADLTFAPLTIAASGTYTPADRTAAAALTFHALTLAASATNTPPAVSGAASLTFAPLDLTASATHTATRTGQAALTFAPLDLVASGAFAAGVFSSTASLTFAPLTIAAAATFTGNFTAAASLTFAPLDLTAAGTFTPKTTHSGAAALTFAPLDLTASGTFASPATYTAAAALTFAPLTLSASANFLSAVCCAGPIATKAFARLVNVSLAHATCGGVGGPCDQLEGRCVELAAAGGDRWTGASFPTHFPCYFVNIFELDLFCTGSGLTMRLTMFNGGGQTAVFEKFFPGVSSIDCDACTTHTLEAVSSNTPCVAAGSTQADVSFGRFEGCGKTCAPQYQVTLAGFGTPHVGNPCGDDGTCATLNGSYVLDHVADDVTPPGCQEFGTTYSEYASTEIEVECTVGDDTYGYCSIHLFVRTTEDCKTELIVVLQFDDTSGERNCNFVSLNGWGTASFPVAQDCESLDATLTAVCLDTGSFCDMTGTTARVQSLPL